MDKLIHSNLESVYDEWKLEVAMLARVREFWKNDVYIHFKTAKPQAQI